MFGAVISPPPRRAVMLVEVLLAVVVLALLAVAFYGTLVSSLKGISIDRVTEAKRFVTQDLLERFAHAETDLPTLLPPAIPGAPRERTLSLDESLAFVGLPAAASRAVRRTLADGGVTGFKLVWYPGISAGPGGGPRALRMDLLWCIPELTATSPGPRADSFRVFAQRGAP